MCVLESQGFVAFLKQIGHGRYAISLFCLYSGAHKRLIRGSFRPVSSSDRQLAACPDDTSILVADGSHRRVQQLSTVDGSCVRFFGDTLGVEFSSLDCQGGNIAASAYGDMPSVIYVFCYADGVLLARVGNMCRHSCFCLLPSGTAVVAVSDEHNPRIHTYDFFGATDVGSSARAWLNVSDVSIDPVDGSVLAVDSVQKRLVRLMADGAVTRVTEKGGADGHITRLRCGRLAVFNPRTRTCDFYFDPLRLVWMAACAFCWHQ